MTKIGRFLRGFSLLAVGFLGLLKTFKPQTPKSNVPVLSLIFNGQAMHFYGLISKLVVLLIMEEIHGSNVQLL